jgi:hypothetical protein
LQGVFAGPGLAARSLGADENTVATANHVGVAVMGIAGFSTAMPASPGATSAARLRPSVGSPLTYDVSAWREYGLPSDGYFARTITREQYLEFRAGRAFEFGGKQVDGYPNGMGFVGSAEEIRTIGTAAGLKDALRLSYEPRYVLEFQLRDPAGLQNVLRAPYAEFVPGGRSGAGFLEWNYPGISSRDIVNPRVRPLK